MSTPSPCQIFGEPILFTESKDHDSIIQTLERPIKGFPKGLPADKYEEALNAGSIPLVFAKAHPNPWLYMDNPAKAVEMVGGRFPPGKHAHSGHVKKEGHPLAYSKLDWGDDPEIDELYRKGKLSLSPALWVTKTPTGEIDKIQIQNILLFPEDEKHRPGDNGTFILNQREAIESMTGEENNKVEKLLQGQIDAITAERDKLKGDFTTFQADVEKEKKDLQVQVETFQAELTKKDEKIKKLEGILDEHLQAKREGEFQTFMASVPDGMKHKEEQVAEIREKFDNDPRSLLLEIATFQAERKKETKRTGTESFETFQDDDDEAEADRKYNELLAGAGRKV